MHRKMPALPPNEMQASSALNFRYLSCLLDKGHITWGQRHLDYLKKYCKVTYTNLLTSGRLGVYLADIDRQALESFERLIEGMKQAQGITEHLKAENALEWVQKIQKFGFAPKSQL